MYLASLVDPFNVPLAPSVPSSSSTRLARRYSCFVRGTMSTCPRTSTNGDDAAFTGDVEPGSIPPMAPNIGWIAVSPILFGLQTSQTTYSTGEYSVPNEEGGPGATDCYNAYSIFQQPVIYTMNVTPGIGAPASPWITPPVIPEYVSGNTIPGNATQGGLPLVSSAAPLIFSNTNILQASSDSDVPWWTVLPTDGVANAAFWVDGSTQEGKPVLNPLNGPTSFTGTQRIRLVSLGIRIAYEGTEQLRGGEIVKLFQPCGDTLAGGFYGGVYRGMFDMEANPPANFRAGSMIIPPFMSSISVPFGQYSDENVGWCPNVPGTGNTFSTLLSYDQCDAISVDRDWVTLKYFPINTSDDDFHHLYDTSSVVNDQSMGGGFEATGPDMLYSRVDSARADNNWGYPMVIMVQGPDGVSQANFKFEIVGHYEVMGDDVRGAIPTAAPDPIGYGAILSTPVDNFQNTNSPVQAYHSVIRTAAQQSFPHPAAVKVAKVDTQTLLDEAATQANHSLTDGGSGGFSLPSIVAGIGDFAKNAKSAYEKYGDTAKEIIGFLGDLF